MPPRFVSMRAARTARTLGELKEGSAERDTSRWTRTLTQTELRYLRLRAAGRSSKEIADLLTIRQVSVNQSLKHAFERLGATDVVHALYLALRDGQVTLAEIGENEE